MSLDLSRPAPARPGSRRVTPLVAWPVSIGAHVVVLGAVLVIPLMAADVLPTPQDVIAFMQTVPVPEPPAPPAPVRPVATVIHAVADQGLAPVQAPSAVGPESGVVIPADSGIGDASRAGIVPGVEGGVPDPLGWTPALPPPPAPPVRPGGDIRRPVKIADASPIYPPLALSARVQGVVIIEAIIGKTGIVEEATVLRSVPLLDAAALAAVRQWRYTPTLLNGVPVSVIMTVTVTFSLDPPKF